MDKEKKSDESQTIIKAEILTRCSHSNARNFKHGRADTPEYCAWQKMKHRCSSPKHKDRYWGRGINICDKWLFSFENFLSDVGLKPSPKHTLERIDNDAGYNPANCRWDTRKNQANNRARTAFITVGGLRMPVSDASALTGVSIKLIHERIRAGMSDDEACSLIDFRVVLRSRQRKPLVSPLPPVALPMAPVVRQGCSPCATGEHFPDDLTTPDDGVDGVPPGRREP